MGTGSVGKVHTVSVKVEYNSADDEVQVSVSPWQVTLKENEEVEWDISGGTNGKINPKGPFDKVPGGQRPKVKARSGAPEGTYTYEITMKCPGKAGQYDVLIDPEMIITRPV